MQFVSILFVGFVIVGCPSPPQLMGGIYARVERVRRSRSIHVKPACLSGMQLLRSTLLLSSAR